MEALVFISLHPGIQQEEAQGFRLRSLPRESRICKVCTLQPKAVSIRRLRNLQAPKPQRSYNSKTSDLTSHPSLQRLPGSGHGRSAGRFGEGGVRANRHPKAPCAQVGNTKRPG